jgi:DNA-binding response OmpR family regulator
MSNPPRILVVDDDPDFAQLLGDYLGLHGCQVQAAEDEPQLRSAVAEFEPDLVLLDQRLGHVSGTDVLRALRAVSDVPCIIVTGASETMDRIVNLEIGADDEMEKTITPREMLARIRSVLRRRRREGDPPAAEAARPSWNLDTERRILRQPGGAVCSLTNAEFETLQMLHAAKGNPVSRAELCRQVFGRPFRVGDRAVDTIVKNLRRKIEPETSEFVSIQAVRTFGYVFVGFP